MNQIWRNPPAVVGRRVSELSFAGERDSSENSTLSEPIQLIAPNWTPIGAVAQRVVSNVARLRASGGVR